jgi:diguanylate cyclase (GGDEF)-like protein
MTGTRTTLLAARLAGCCFLVVGLVGLALAWPGREVSASGALATGELWPIAATAVGLAAAAFLVPWSSLPRPAGLALPVAALVLLAVVDELTGYSTRPGSAAVYPIFLVLVLAWVGLTQPRTTAALFALSAGATLAYVLLRSPAPTLPLSSLLVVLPAGVALGETCSFLATRVRVLAERERRRAHHLDQLARLTSQLPGLTTSDEAAELVARAATELFDGVPVSVELADLEATKAAEAYGRNDGDRVSPAGMGNALRLDPAVPASSVVAPPLLASAGAGRRQGDLRPRRSGQEEAGRRHAGMSVPLVGASGVVGNLHLETTTASADDYTGTLARLFASQVGVALEQFQLIRRLDRAAHRDDLTGTGNRRHAELLLQSLREGDAVLLVDLDHFKTVNDTWGHRAGDEVLQALGAYLQSCVRSSDDVARYGGDEFVVLARGAGADTAATADRLLRGWREAGHKTTISIGVAVHHSPQSPATILDAADAALYAAKSQGRNRVAIEDTVAG